MFSNSALERLPIGRGAGRRRGAPRRRGAGLWLVLAVVPLLASASASRALAATATEEEQQAEALIREGVQLRGQDQTARALPLFEKAYQLARTPRTAGQLGLCELELGFFAEAELYLSEALATPNHPWIAKNRTTLKRQLEAARANVGELSLTVSPSTAEVLLDKKPAGKVGLGVPVHLRKGPVELEITAPGYRPVQQIVTIVAGKRTEHSYALVPLPPAPTAPVADSAPPVTLATSQPTTSTGEPGQADPRRIAAWVTGGAALVALTLGTIEALSAASKSDDFNNHTSVVGGTALPDCTTVSLSPQCKPLKDAYDRALTLSVVGFATAGALAVASSVLFVLSSSGHVGNGERADVTPGFACVPDLGVRGLGCSLRF
jgi:tetratricopeptide (TPR) repeat protein